MTNISILQPEDDTANSSITLPDSFVTLKNTDTGSTSLLLVLQLFLDDKKRDVLKKLRGLAAAEVANFLDELITMKLHDQPRFRRRTIRVLQTLCGSWGVLPASYTLQGEVTVTAKYPWTCAGFGEIWYGTRGSEKVAVKIIKITGSANPEKLKKQLSKETIIWKRLNHRNLLPLYGVSTGIKITGIEYEHPCLVSPWMENGNVRDFVRKNPTFNRFDLLLDVCQGLIYLHSEGFVHGDLKGDNVLVDNENRARLADFGFAGVCVPFGVAGASNSSDVGGTAVYMAPELLIHQISKDRSSIPPLKKPVDVYALGMLIYEVLSGQRPFHGIHHDAIKLYVIRGNRPHRPPWSPIPDHPIWDTVELCWRQEPAQRPKLTKILRTLTSTNASPPAAWPSPPVTPASTSSIPNSSPRTPPTPPTDAVALPDLPPDTPRIPVTEPPPRPHHPSRGILITVLPSRPLLPSLLLPSLPPPFPPPATPRHQTRSLLMRDVIQLVSFQNNPAFRWRVVGGGITKRQHGAGNGSNP